MAGRELLQLPYLLFKGEIFMHRVMVFIDYQNFNINLKEHYRGKTFKPIIYMYHQI